VHAVIDEVLRNSVGRRLTKIVGDFHVFEGEVSTTPNSLWLTFEGMPRYHIRGSSDGEHLMADREDPEEFDMQQLGAIRLLDMAGQEPFLKVFNQCLRRAWLISFAWPGTGTIGARLDFDTAMVRVLNWGDDIHIAEDFPSDARPDEFAETPL